MNIILLACGSFNPPTLAHLRMMEMAKERLKLYGLKVVKGFFSPVNDAYKKPDLASAYHRIEMLKLACQDSNWLAVDEWESIHNTEWTPTAKVLQRIEKLHPDHRTMLVVGSDILKSFNMPNLWTDEDLNLITSPNHGLVIIQRGDMEELYQLLYKHAILYANQPNIFITYQPVKDGLSSTIVRNLVKMNLSIKGLVNKEVEKYIIQNDLYQIKG